MNTLPSEIVNLMVKLVPVSYGTISRLSRWYYACIRGDLEEIKTLSLRPVKSKNYSYWELPNGWRHGEYIIYCDYGNIKVETTYVDNMLHGTYKSYKSGWHMCTTNYKYGKHHGKEIEYYETGQVYRITKYVDGKKHGKRKYYNKNGELQMTFDYYNDCTTQI